MKKLSITDIKASEILSKEERKMVVGGIGRSCWDGIGCYPTEKCVGDICVNVSYMDPKADCYVVTWKDAGMSGDNLYYHQCNNYYDAIQYANWEVAPKRSCFDIEMYSC